MIGTLEEEYLAQNVVVTDRLESGRAFECGVDDIGNSSGFIGSPRSKRKMLHDLKGIKEVRARGQT